MADGRWPEVYRNHLSRTAGRLEACNMIDTGLKNRIVLVTGANNPYGIGAATTKAFVAEGAQVFLTYLRQPGPPVGEVNVMGEAFYRAQQTLTADHVVQTIRERGGRAKAWEVDLAEAALIPQLFDRVEAELGPVEVLINNAAYCVPDTFIPPGELGPDSRAVDRSEEHHARRGVSISSQEKLLQQATARQERAGVDVRLHWVHG